MKTITIELSKAADLVALQIAIQEEQKRQAGRLAATTDRSIASEAAQLIAGLENVASQLPNEF